MPQKKKVGAFEDEAQAKACLSALPKEEGNEGTAKFAVYVVKWNDVTLYVVARNSKDACGTASMYLGMTAINPLAQPRGGPPRKSIFDQVATMSPDQKKQLIAQLLGGDVPPNGDDDNDLRMLQHGGMIARERQTPPPAPAPETPSARNPAARKKK